LASGGEKPQELSSSFLPEMQAHFYLLFVCALLASVQCQITVQQWNTVLNVQGSTCNVDVTETITIQYGENSNPLTEQIYVYHTDLKNISVTSQDGPVEPTSNTEISRTRIYWYLPRWNSTVTYTWTVRYIATNVLQAITWRSDVQTGNGDVIQVKPDNTHTISWKPSEKTSYEPEATQMRVNFSPSLSATAPLAVQTSPSTTSIFSSYISWVPLDVPNVYRVWFPYSPTANCAAEFPIIDSELAEAVGLAVGAIVGIVIAAVVICIIIPVIIIILCCCGVIGGAACCAAAAAK